MQISAAVWFLAAFARAALAWTSIPIETVTPTFTPVAAPPAAECVLTSPTVTPSSLPFPAIGSWSQDYSPEGLEKLWDLVNIFFNLSYRTSNCVLQGWNSSASSIYYDCITIFGCPLTISTPGYLPTFLCGSTCRYTKWNEVPSEFHEWLCNGRISI